MKNIDHTIKWFVVVCLQPTVSCQPSSRRMVA